MRTALEPTRYTLLAAVTSARLVPPQNKYYRRGAGCCRFNNNGNDKGKEHKFGNNYLDSFILCAQHCDANPTCFTIEWGSSSDSGGCELHGRDGPANYPVGDSINNGYTGSTGTGTHGATPRP